MEAVGSPKRKKGSGGIKNEPPSTPLKANKSTGLDQQKSVPLQKKRRTNSHLLSMIALVPQLIGGEQLLWEDERKLYPFISRDGLLSPCLWIYTMNSLP